MIHATADESFASSARIGAGPSMPPLPPCGTGSRSSATPAWWWPAIPAVPPPRAASWTGCRARLQGSTRSAAANRVAAAEHPDGALWVIGNAPTALARLLELHDRGAVRPAAVVGLPVGYVGAAEAKAALWGSPLAAPCHHQRGLPGWQPGSRRRGQRPRGSGGEAVTCGHLAHFWSLK